MATEETRDVRRKPELTERIVESVREGILAYDRECRYTLWNREMERISGVTASNVLGRRAFDVFPFLVETGEDWFFFEALAGRKCSSRAQRFHVPESGRSGFFEADYSPLHDVNATIIGGIAIIRDVTARRVEEDGRVRVAAHAAVEAAARRFEFLAEAGEVLASSLDYEHSLDALAHLTIGVLGDACIIDIVEEGNLRTVALTHARPEKKALVEELRRRFPPTPTSPQPVGRVLRQRKAEMVSVVEPDVIAAHAVNAEHADLVRRIGIRSHLAVPLVARGTFLGVINLAITEGDRRYDDRDLALATDLARRAALAIDNSLLYRAAQTELAERRRVDAELRLSEQRFRALFEQSPLSKQILSCDGTTMRVNAAWERLTGTTLEAIKGSNVFEDPQLAALGVTPLLRRAVEGETVAIPTMRYDPAQTRPAASTRPPLWLRALAYPINDANGCVHELVVVHEDVTAQVAASERVRASEERLRMALQSARMCVWEFDIPTNRVQCSENGRELYGIDAGEPADFLAVVHPDDRGVLMGARAAESADDFYRVEYRVRVGGGQERWLQSAGRLERDAEGNRQRLLGVSIDITDRKAAEIATAVLADAGRTLNSSLDAAARLRDLAPVVVPRLADWCAIDLVDDLGAFAPVVPPPRGSASPTSRMMQTKEPLWLREVTASDGFEASSLVCVPLIANGEVLGALTLARGETGRRYEASDVDVAVILARRAAAAVENARLYERLRDEDRRKDEFLATLAHELRNPLAPVRTGLDVLRASAKGDRSTEAVRAVMERQLQHMTRLIDDLLDVSRVSRGKIELRPEPLDVADVVRTAIEVSGPALEAAGLRVDLKVPAVGPPVVVCADRTRLAQVFSNLLNNAAKFTPVGGAVTIEVRRVGPEAEVRVIDTGIGIDRTLLARVFELFVQAANDGGRGQSGLGIGLTLVRRLVELHGGRVWAESEGRDRGSAFVVRLPLAGAGESARDREPTKKTTRGAVTPRRILVVDDNVDAARMLVVLLEMDEHVVRCAASGPEALALVKDFTPEIALLDIGLPGMSGIELARELRANESLRGVVLVAVTGWGHEEDRQRSREAGFDHHLTKPMEASDLDDVIDSLDRRGG